MMFSRVSGLSRCWKWSHHMFMYLLLPTLWFSLPFHVVQQYKCNFAAKSDQIQFFYAWMFMYPACQNQCSAISAVTQPHESRSIAIGSSASRKVVPLHCRYAFPVKHWAYCDSIWVWTTHANTKWFLNGVQIRRVWWEVEEHNTWFAFLRGKTVNKRGRLDIPVARYLCDGFDSCP